jgi:hypothetical protein
MKHSVIGSNENHLWPILVPLIEPFASIRASIETLIDEKGRGFSNDGGIGMEDIPQFP